MLRKQIITIISFRPLVGWLVGWFHSVVVIAIVRLWFVWRCTTTILWALQFILFNKFSNDSLRYSFSLWILHYALRVSAYCKLQIFTLIVQIYIYLLLLVFFTKVLWIVFVFLLKLEWVLDCFFLFFSLSSLITSLPLSHSLSHSLIQTIFTTTVFVCIISKFKGKSIHQSQKNFQRKNVFAFECLHNGDK